MCAALHVPRAGWCGARSLKCPHAVASTNADHTSTTSWAGNTPRRHRALRLPCAPSSGADVARGRWHAWGATAVCRTPVPQAVWAVATAALQCRAMPPPEGWQEVRAARSPPRARAIRARRCAQRASTRRGRGDSMRCGCIACMRTPWAARGGCAAPRVLRCAHCGHRLRRVLSAVALR